MLTTRSALLVSLALLFACSPVPSTPPNVLLIVVDTLRADHLSYNGYASATTPELDKLASQSLNFERAYAAAAWTRPSIASILTGLDPLSHGANFIDQRLPEKLETLAEWVGSPPETKADTPIFSETYFKHSVSKGRYKLMRDLEKGRAALYDLIADPSEQNNLISERPVVAKQLAGLLKERARKTRQATESYQPAPEMLEQLRALGYAEDEPTDGLSHP